MLIEILHENKKILVSYLFDSNEKVHSFYIVMINKCRFVHNNLIYVSIVEEST